MVIKKKPIIYVILKNEGDASCAKCCKTKTIVERLFTEIPEFKQKIDVCFEDIDKIDVKHKYGAVNPPAIIIQKRILFEGHVPIMKKLARELYQLIEITT